LRKLIRPSNDKTATLIDSMSLVQIGAWRHRSVTHNLLKDCLPSILSVVLLLRLLQVNLKLGLLHEFLVHLCYHVLDVLGFIQELSLLRNNHLVRAWISLQRVVRSTCWDVTCTSRAQQRSRCRCIFVCCWHACERLCCLLLLLLLMLIIPIVSALKLRSLIVASSLVNFYFASAVQGSDELAAFGVEWSISTRWKNFAAGVCFALACCSILVHKVDIALHLLSFQSLDGLLQRHIVAQTAFSSSIGVRDLIEGSIVTHG
jgi:hypothetical protein